MPITTPYKVGGLTAALKPVPSTPSPYDTSRSVGGLAGVPQEQTFPFTPLTPQPDPAPQATQSPPSSSPTIATPPPPAAPAPAAPAPTSVGGLQIADYTADPILVRTKALSQQAVADAQAAAAAQTKNLLTQYGHTPGSDTSLYPDQNTVLAAEQNPYSVLANLGYTHAARTRGLEENVNNANLWYSGEHARELGNESHLYTGEQAGASAALQQALAAVRANVLAAQRGAEQQNLSAEEAAMQRAIEYALKYGFTPGTGAGGTPPTGTTSGSGTPGDPFVYNPSPGTIGAISTPPSAGNPAGVAQSPRPAGGTGAVSGAGTPSSPYVYNPSASTIGAISTTPSASNPAGIAGGTTRATAQTSAGTITPTDPVAASAAQSGGATYGLVRNSTSLPGNKAPDGVAQASLYNADDPLAQQNVTASPGSGFWVPSHTNETADAYAARVNALKAANPGATIMLDIELEGKGYPGSPGYQWTQDVMSKTGGGQLSVTVPGGGEDDFNYQPFVQSGSMIWIQTYGADANHLMDPQERYNMMLARGVPANQIGLMLMPGQQPIPGVPYSYYTLDDMQGNYPTAPAPAPTGSTGSLSFLSTTAAAPKPSIVQSALAGALGTAPANTAQTMAAPLPAAPTNYIQNLAALLAPTAPKQRQFTAI